ncbi:CAB5 [Candida margitis]|uniref:CAB5 n=1 Tax=Candida margitis TaxID=1775924 RepID=UPI0022261A15|nr:CAB5 [Candida margitis]KAI5962032.1 CAB5 [Candida margitis]
MLIVGLTGGIACGKSTVSHELKTKYHYTVIDADLIAREVVLPGKPAYNKIVTSFNDVHGLLHDDGSLNRTVLGQVVFQDKKKLKTLNSIVHPAVRWEIVRQILGAYMSCKSLVILDVPLLFESQLYMICGLIVTVSTKSELQIERLLARNTELSKEDAENRIKSQMTNEERNYKSDIVIDNSGSVSGLKDTIAILAREIKPKKFWTILDLVPPIGIASALFTFLIRRITEIYKGQKPKNS